MILTSGEEEQGNKAKCDPAERKRISQFELVRAENLSRSEKQPRQCEKQGGEAPDEMLHAEARERHAFSRRMGEQPLRCVVAGRVEPRRPWKDDREEQEQ